MLRLALTLPILAGCQLVFELEEPPPEPCLIDDFGGNALAPHWRRTGPSNGPGPSVAGDQLHLPIAPLVDDFGKVESAVVFDLTNGSMEVALAGVPYQGANAPGNVEFGIYVQDAENYTMVAGSKNLVLIHIPDLNNTDDRDDAVIDFDPNSDTHWAIRFQNGKVSWETSPDGVNWIARRIVESSRSRKAVFFGVFVTSYSNGVSDPGEAIVERVVIEGKCQ